MKIRLFCKIMFAVLVVLILTVPAMAQVPQQINYQGSLTNLAGNPVPDDDYDMYFAIYDASVDGTELWGEPQTVTVASGIYNVILGNPGNLIDPADLDGDRYLGVTVGTDNEMTPRQKLTSTAFSLKAAVAEDAETLDGMDSAAFAAASHNHSATDIATGTLSTSYYSAYSDLSAEGYLGNASGDIARNNGTLQVNLNASLLNGFSSSSFMGAATDNWVKTTGDTMTGALNLPSNGLTVGTNQLVVTDGRVGLGTTSPDEQLELTGNLKLSSTGMIMSESETLIHTWGPGNFFAGQSAGNLFMTGGGNTASGGAALFYNTTGFGNTACGYEALTSNITGFGNTAIGADAGYSNQTGINNTFVGKSAGYNTTGSSNVFIGYNAGADETGSNKFYIDNTNTTDPLIWGDFDSNTAAINGRLGVGTQPGSTYQFHSRDNRTGGRAIYGQATGTSAIGVWGHAEGSNGTGVWGNGTLYDFYAAGPGANYAPFTGAHECRLSGDSPEEIRPGMIVSATGRAEARQIDEDSVSLSSTMATVELSRRSQNKAVFGVLAREAPLPEGHWYAAAEGERFAVVNAVGEGRVWVTDITGGIEAGDYITTSSVPGYGRKQDDDLLHSYTLGKAIETVNWESVTETVEYNGRSYKVYLVAVVYTSG